MSDRIHATVMPSVGDVPVTGEFHVNGIPAIYISGALTTCIQLRRTDLPDAVRYLRELAAVATDLADQVQDQVAKAVLEG